MDVLWAPWRMEYIVSDRKDGGCIFCPGEDRDSDEARLILHVGPLSMVMMNRYPYINGHMLVAPVRHVSGVEPLEDEEMLDLMRTVRRCIEVLRKVMNPEGFNVGLNLGTVAGAGVKDHVHFHIVPRWNGDTNYMTVCGAVRVIPQHLEDTYHALRPHFESSPSAPGGEQ